MIVYVLLFIIVLLTILYTFRKDYQKYWHSRGVPYYRGKFDLGFFWEFITGDKGLFEILNDLYKKFPDAPAVGYGSLLKPAMLVTDIENIQQILSGDFASFHHRGIDTNSDIDPLTDSAVFNNGMRWKLSRQKLSPIFTAAKLRSMYYILNKSAIDFVEYLKEYKNKDKAFDILGIFCSAAVSAAVFGITTESTMKSPFLHIARQTTAPSFILNIKFTIANISHKLFRLLRIKIFGEFEDFFIGAIKKILRLREKDVNRKHDFADMCIGLQKEGTMRDPKTGYEIEPTDEWVAAQAFFFYVAGVEPSATCMFFTLFELAKHPEILKKVQKEIDYIFDKNNGEVNYDDVVSFQYLEMVIDEAMRIHPPLGSLTRKCVQNTVLKIGNIPVEEDTQIHIPIYAIHRDPKFYPNPEVFDPERFSPESKQKRQGCTYLPFGEGNRMCLGMRFARLQVKTGLVYILKNFTVKTEHINTKVKYGKSPFAVRPENIDFQFIERR